MSYSIPGRRLILALFLIFLLLPIYWLVNMSFKTNSEIVSTMTLWPHTPTLQHYRRIFTDESWYSGYINSLEYVVLNTIISIELVKIALGQFDLGKAAALSLVYNLIILIVCWVFYTVMTNAGAERKPRTKSQEATEQDPVAGLKPAFAKEGVA